jgi:hypothetical protein
MICEHVGIERVSIELTQRCTKSCWFCYSRSHAEGQTLFTPDEVTTFVRDLARHGVRAVSFGGGEPLGYAGVFDILHALRGILFRSLTTNGLLLSNDQTIADLVAAAPEKVHVSVHFPDRQSELRRVISQVRTLEAHGIVSGVNLLVARSGLAAARDALVQLQDAGIGLNRIVLLPMRGQDTPTAAQIAHIAGHRPFQSMTCLLACGKSPRFCAVAWDKTVAWCSYTAARRPMASLTYEALTAALADLGVTFCGGDHDDNAVAAARLSRRAQHGHDLVRGRS